MAIAAMDYIDVDEAGVARVAGSRIKVRYLAELHTRAGMSPEQIHADYSHLSLAQIHAALAYYYDRKEQYDAEIDEGMRRYEEMRANAPPSPFVQRMRAEGRLP